MTALPVRRVPFDFDESVPFLWNPANPAFSLQMNTTSIIAIAFEKYIVTAVKEAIPKIADPDVAAEADTFLRQEAQHARAHRQHLRGLIRTYPGLQTVVDDTLALYDELLESKPLTYHLAYIADLESAFTPAFKLFLDHEDVLFRPGDDRVASLFLWHFTEEVEHRSSGLRIYREFGSEAYRLRVLPSVARHILRMVGVIADGFDAHVPFADRRIDARLMRPSVGLRAALAEKVRRPGRGGAAGAGTQTGARFDFSFAPKRECRSAVWRILRAQLPNHDPEHQPLPRFADAWMERYDAGESVSAWYAGAPAPTA